MIFSDQESQAQMSRLVARVTSESDTGWEQNHGKLGTARFG